MQHRSAHTRGKNSFGSELARAGLFETIKSIEKRARPLGYVIMAVAVLYVGYHAYFSISQSPVSYFTFANGVRVAVAATVYLIACVAAAWAWVILLNGLSDFRLPVAEGIQIYAVTQILKYLPSNVVHAAGRYLMTRKRGASNSTIVLSMLFETLLMAAAAATLAVVMGGTRYGKLFDAIDGHPFLTTYAATLAAAILLAGCAAVAYFFGRKFLARLTAAYLLLLLFFILSGAICLYLVFGSDWLGSPDRAVMFVGVVALAWLAGWVTPGASAGLGVREAVIVLLLQSEIGIYDASYLAVAYRVATTGGNVVFALLGLAAGRKSDASSGAERTSADK